MFNVPSMYLVSINKQKDEHHVVHNTKHSFMWKIGSIYIKLLYKSLVFGIIKEDDYEMILFTSLNLARTERTMECSCLVILNEVIDIY